MDGIDVLQLSIEAVIALIYGSRARLSDLQRISDRDMPRKIDTLRDAQRMVQELDTQLVALAANHPELAEEIYHLIKASHDGSVQRLSQRMRAGLPI
jgi:histone deacetylase complex regulatory component SIN3